MEITCNLAGRGVRELGPGEMVYLGVIGRLQNLLAPVESVALPVSPAGHDTIKVLHFPFRLTCPMTH